MKNQLPKRQHHAICVLNGERVYNGLVSSQYWILSFSLRNMFTILIHHKIDQLYKQLLLMRSLYWRMIDHEAEFNDVKKLQQQIREIEKSLKSLQAGRKLREPNF